MFTATELSRTRPGSAGAFMTSPPSAAVLLVVSEFSSWSAQGSCTRTSTSSPEASRIGGSSLLSEASSSSTNMTVGVSSPSGSGRSRTILPSASASRSAWRCARARSRCCFAMRALTADTGIPAALATVAAKEASSSGSSSLIASIAIASSTTPSGVASALRQPVSAAVADRASCRRWYRPPPWAKLWMTSAPSGARITLALQRP